MPTELDQRIRTLVTRVVDLSPSAPELDIGEPAGHRRGTYELATT